MGKTRWLTAIGRKVRDGVGGKHYTWITWMVPLPERSTDQPALIVSIATGPKSRVMLRFRDVAEMLEALTPTPDDQAKITQRLVMAHERVSELARAERLAELARRGTPIYRGDTGERVGEAREEYHALDR